VAPVSCVNTSVDVEILPRVSWSYSICGVMMVKVKIGKFKGDYSKRDSSSRSSQSPSSYPSD
jgi:hypothetical protein